MMTEILIVLILLALVFFLFFIFSLVTKTRFKDWLSPRRWKSVLIYILKFTIKKLGDTSPQLLYPFEIEQYMFRTLACKDCIPSNKCKSCGCNTVGRMNTTADSCSAGRWGPFMTKYNWEKLKETLKIEFKLTLNNKDVSDIDF